MVSLEDVHDRQAVKRAKGLERDGDWDGLYLLLTMGTGPERWAAAWRGLPKKMPPDERERFALALLQTAQVDPSMDVREQALGALPHVNLPVADVRDVVLAALEEEGTWLFASVAADSLGLVEAIPFLRRWTADEENGHMAQQAIDHIERAASS